MSLLTDWSNTSDADDADLSPRHCQPLQLCDDDEPEDDQSTVSSTSVGSLKRRKRAQAERARPRSGVKSTEIKKQTPKKTARSKSTFRWSFVIYARFLFLLQSANQQSRETVVGTSVGWHNISVMQQCGGAL